MANTILPGYETKVSNKTVVYFDHNGPASYTTFVPGASPTGGDPIANTDLSEGGFEAIETDMLDPTGQFTVYVCPVSGGTGNAIKSMTLVWYSQVTATVGGQAQTAGAQVASTTNLSTFAVRVRAWCP